MRTFVRHGRETHELIDVLLVGRSSRCDVTLDDELVSREHCRFERDGDVARVVDLGSHNGVHLNDRRIDGRAEVHHGDVVGVGASRLILLRQGEEPGAGRGSAMGTRPADPAGAAGDAIAFEAFERAARDALDRGELAAAQAGARELASHAATLPAALFERTVPLLLDLAEACEDPYWLGRSIEVHLARRQPIDEPTAARLAALAEPARAPIGSILADYLAALSRMDGGAAQAERLLRGLAARLD